MPAPVQWDSRPSPAVPGAYLAIPGLGGCYRTQNHSTSLLQSIKTGVLRQTHGRSGYTSRRLQHVHFSMLPNHASEAIHAELSVVRASQAQSAQAAEIWLWDTATWAPLGRLAAHGLTVTQLAFSPDGRYLASASRDRSFAVFAEAQPAAAGVPGQLSAAVQQLVYLVSSASTRTTGQSGWSGPFPVCLVLRHGLPAKRCRVLPACPLMLCIVSAYLRIYAQVR